MSLHRTSRNLKEASQQVWDRDEHDKKEILSHVRLSDMSFEVVKYSFLSKFCHLDVLLRVQHKVEKLKQRMGLTILTAHKGRFKPCMGLQIISRRSFRRVEAQTWTNESRSRNRFCFRYTMIGHSLLECHRKQLLDMEEPS